MRLGLVLMRMKPMRHGDGQHAHEQPGGRPGQPQQPEEDRGEDDRRAHVAAEHDQPEQHEGHRNERHQHVLPLRQQPLVLFAGEQVGAPQHERELAELAGLELEGAADGDPVLVAVDRHSYPRHLHQDHQEDGAAPGSDRPAPGAACTGIREATSSSTAADTGRQELLAEEVRPRQRQLQRRDLRGRVDHHQAEHGDQQAAAEDQVVRGQRPVPGLAGRVRRGVRTGLSRGGRAATGRCGARWTGGRPVRLLGISRLLPSAGRT